MIQEFLLLFFKTIALVLEEAVVGRNDATTHIICPDPCSRTLIGICRHQVRSVLWECFLEKLAKNSALIQRLSLVLQCGNKAARIEIKQRLWLVIRVDFNVLVLDAFFFERNPYTLNKGTKPARVELQRTFSRVSLGEIRTMTWR